MEGEESGLRYGSDDNDGNSDDNDGGKGNEEGRSGRFLVIGTIPDCDFSCGGHAL